MRGFCVIVLAVASSIGQLHSFEWNSLTAYAIFFSKDVNVINSRKNNKICEVSHLRGSRFRLENGNHGFVSENSNVHIKEMGSNSDIKHIKKASHVQDLFNQAERKGKNYPTRKGIYASIKNQL
jgi:hypothetical protein